MSYLAALVRLPFVGVSNGGLMGGCLLGRCARPDVYGFLFGVSLDWFVFCGGFFYGRLVGTVVFFGVAGRLFGELIIEVGGVPFGISRDFFHFFGWCVIRHVRRLLRNPSFRRPTALAHWPRREAA